SSIIHVILQRATNQAGLVKIGRSYYEKEMMNEDEFLLKDYNIRLFRGYSMNIEQTMKGLQLTVDLSHRVVSTINASDLIDSFDKNLKPLPPGGMTKGAPVKQHKGEVLRGYHRGVPTMNKAFAANQMFDDRDKENTPEIQRRAEEELVGRSVITTYRLRNWRIDAIEWDKNIDSTFSWKKKSGETVKISFRDYFYTNYRLKLVSKRFGMLVSMPKSRRGKGPDKFYLPPEACYLTGMSKKMKADFRMMKRVRDIVSLTPPKRFEAIENITRDLSK
ncbi:Piwi-like protein 1, partial [Bonamia ostreae]